MNDSLFKDRISEQVMAESTQEEGDRSLDIGDLRLELAVIDVELKEVAAEDNAYQ